MLTLNQNVAVGRLLERIHDKYRATYPLTPEEMGIQGTMLSDLLALGVLRRYSVTTERNGIASPVDGFALTARGVEYLILNSQSSDMIRVTDEWHRMATSVMDELMEFENTTTPTQDMSKPQSEWKESSIFIRHTWINDPKITITVTAWDALQHIESGRFSEVRIPMEILARAMKSSKYAHGNDFKCYAKTNADVAQRLSDLQFKDWRIK